LLSIGKDGELGLDERVLAEFAGEDGRSERCFDASGREDLDGF
jgi:hypothetical protein